MLRRVPLIAGLALAFFCAPLPATAQQPAKVPRVGVLLFGTPEADPALPALRQGLRDHGYVEGRNINFEYRYAEGRPERLPDLARTWRASSRTSSTPPAGTRHKSPGRRRQRSRSSRA